MQIDAVITWVDGEDEFHQKKINKYVKNKQKANSVGFKTRYNQVEEIKYCVHSIIKYAQFINNIFIVTDNQIPDFYKNKKEGEYKNVFIVSHEVIFKIKEKYLPVFNSRSIETELYRIPNLSEYFLYFNDDMFLLKDVKSTDFFINGLPVIRGEWKKFKKDIFYKKIIKKSKTKRKRASHIKAQEKGAKLVGFNKFYKFKHVPYVFRKSTLKDYFKENKKIEKRNLKYRFRHRKQYLIQSLANHIEIKNKTCIIKKDYQLVSFQNYKKPFFWLKFKLNILCNNKNKLFLNVQSLDQCPDKKLKYILNWFDKKYKLYD